MPKAAHTRAPYARFVNVTNSFCVYWFLFTSSREFRLTSLSIMVCLRTNGRLGAYGHIFWRVVSPLSTFAPLVLDISSFSFCRNVPIHNCAVAVVDLLALIYDTATTPGGAILQNETEHKFWSTWVNKTDFFLSAFQHSSVWSAFSVAVCVELYVILGSILFISIVPRWRKRCLHGSMCVASQAVLTLHGPISQNSDNNNWFLLADVLHAWQVDLYVSVIGIILQSDYVAFEKPIYSPFTACLSCVCPSTSAAY